MGFSLSPNKTTTSLSSKNKLDSLTLLSEKSWATDFIDIMGDKDQGFAPSPLSDPIPAMGVTRCRELIQKSLKEPKVKLLIESMEKCGCKIPSNFIRAVNCGGRYAGGFSRGNGIVICGNHLIFKDEVIQAVTHELIHAYDDCRASNLDWGNAFHQACSEIRANHLSGDCHLVREFLRKMVLFDTGKKIKAHEPDCVKRRSMQSVAANHTKEAAKFAVDAVWDSCYNDTAPFGKVP